MKTIRVNADGILNRDHVVEILKPHLSNIVGSIQDGWDAWELFRETAPELFRPLGPTARANFVYCQMVASAERRFQGVEGVHLTKKRGFLSVVFQGKVELRFKKLDRNLRSSGIPTQQFLRFISQEVMPGFEQTKVIGGYCLDKLGAAIDGIHLTCPGGDRNLWCCQLSVGQPLPAGVITSDAEVRPAVRSTRDLREQKKTG